MENKKNKKWSLAHICAYVSFAISVTTLVLWCCNVGGFTVVSLDSFVGIIVALLAIVVTIVLGWQIYNAIELKRKIEELDELKDKLSVQENEIKQQSRRSRHLIAASLADIETTGGNHILAFSYLMTSLSYSLALEQPLNVGKLLDRMTFSASHTRQDALCLYTKDIHDSDKRIRKSQHFDMIKTQYEKIYNEFISKVKDDPNAQ